MHDGKVHKQSAYTADELEAFLADLYGEFNENLPRAKFDVAEDVLGAIRAAIVEYGLNARYVGDEVGIREGGRRKGRTLTATKIIINRNVDRLKVLAAKRKAVKDIAN